MKRLSLSLLFLLLFFSACRTTPTPPSSSSSSSEMTSSTTTEESSSSSSTETTQISESHSEIPVPIETRRNIVGTWKQENQTLTVQSDGTWQLTGEINSSGTLTVAADFEDTQLLKLYGFNENIDGIGTYFIANFNQDSTKMGFGYLGQFNRLGNVTEVNLSTDVFQNDIQTTPVDFNTTILGTWTIKEGTEFHNTWNYNPDGTFVTFSQGRGQAMTGEYRVKQLNGNWVDVTYTFDEDGQSYTSLYLIENGMMIENHFEDIKIVRNVIPDFPS